MIEVVNLKVRGLMPLTVTVPAGARQAVAVAGAAARARLMDAVAGAGPWEGGSVRICGVDMALRPLVARGHLGYCPEALCLDPAMTVGDTLAFWWRAREMEKGFAARRKKVMELCGLTGLAGARVGRLDAGKAMRLNLARALLHDPEALVLGGAAGLDRALLDQIGQGRAILVGTAGQGTPVEEEKP